MGFLRRLLAAVLYLTAGPRRLKARPVEGFARLCLPLEIISALVGIGTILLWQAVLGATWQRTLNWVLPALVTALAIGLVFYRQAARSLLELASLRRPLPAWGYGLALGAVAFLLGLGLNFGVRYWDSDRVNSLPQYLQWLWPEPLYRVLLLMPLWGSWAMIVLVQFYPPTERTDEPTRALAVSARPLAAAVFLLLPLALSLTFLSFLHPWHFVPPAAACLAALGGGSLLIREEGHLSRRALLAANFLTQCGFGAAYLAVMR